MLDGDLACDRLHLLLVVIVLLHVDVLVLLLVLHRGHRLLLLLVPRPPEELRVSVEDGRPVRVVLLHVPVEVGLLAEGAVAQAAAVRLLLVVDVPHVALKVGGDGEAALTVLALVRLLPCVGS